MANKLSGYYLLKEDHWAFAGGSAVSPIAKKGTLLRYWDVLDRDGDSYAPFSEPKPRRGDYIFLVESEDPWGFEIALGNDEIERFVESLEVTEVRWAGDIKNSNITIRWGSSGEQEFFSTGADLASRLNEILKSQGVLIDGALIWCLDLPHKTSPCKFYRKGSKLENC